MQAASMPGSFQAGPCWRTGRGGTTRQAGRIGRGRVKRPSPEFRSASSQRCRDGHMAGGIIPPPHAVHRRFALLRDGRNKAVVVCVNIPPSPGKWRTGVRRPIASVRYDMTVSIWRRIHDTTRRNAAGKCPQPGLADRLHRPGTSWSRRPSATWQSNDDGGGGGGGGSGGGY